MRKRKSLVWFLLAALGLTVCLIFNSEILAQYVSRNFNENLGSGALPATCAVGDRLYTTDTRLSYVCSALHTWVLIGTYNTIQDETAPLLQRNIVNFAGAGIACVDNAGTLTTDCTIAGGGAASNTYGTVAALPGVCAAGDTYRTSDSIYTYLSTAANTWTAFYKDQRVVPPSSAGWSWDNQAGSTINSTNGYEYLSVPDQANTTVITLRYRAAPATPYTVKMLLKHDISGAPPGLNGSGLAVGYGVAFRDAAGKIIEYRFYRGLTNVDMATTKWTNSTTVSAGYLTYSPAVTNSSVQDSIFRADVWFAISDTGVNLNFYWSIDGFHWKQFDSRARTDFFAAGPNAYGFFAYAKDSAVELALISLEVLAAAAP